MPAVHSIIAVRVVLETGESRYFLTWGRLGRNDPWPGDIERAVLRASSRYSLGGSPSAAKVCDSLQDAAAERYFFECLLSMRTSMPTLADPEWDMWADETSRGVLEGKDLYYCGQPKAVDPPIDPNARHGYVPEWFDHEGDLVGECELRNVTTERLQVLLGDDDADRVMCLTNAVAGQILHELAHEADVAIEPERFEYFVSPWADPGYRTPGGYWPPPRILPAFPGAEKQRPGRKESTADDR